MPFSHCGRSFRRRGSVSVSPKISMHFAVKGSSSSSSSASRRHDGVKTLRWSSHYSRERAERQEASIVISDSKRWQSRAAVHCKPLPTYERYRVLEAPLHGVLGHLAKRDGVSLSLKARDFSATNCWLKEVDLSDNSEVHDRRAVADNDHRWSSSFKVLRSSSNSAVS
jgi:hypothetical protein